MTRARAASLAAVTLSVALASYSGLIAQPSLRKTTTVAALLQYPAFFHGLNIRLRGELSPNEGGGARLTSGDASILLVARQGTDRPQGADASSTVEVRGAFWDVGRLTSDDPRVSGVDLERLSQQRFNKNWPGIGELLIVFAERIEPALPAPTVRTIAIDPTRYVDQRVTVRGQFRGRNLYGDLPDNPGRTRWDFVLRSADAAIWVTSFRPHGKEFNLDVTARADTNKW